jgi:hypothetical protein
VIEVKTPSEIRSYKGKLLGGFNARQLIGLGGALAVGVPVGFLGYGHIPGDVLPWLVIASAAPFLAFGFIPFKGMYFEEYVKVIFDFSTKVREVVNRVCSHFHTVMIGCQGHCKCAIGVNTLLSVTSSLM